MQQGEHKYVFAEQVHEEAGNMSVPVKQIQEA
jgi:hypothetical protein